MSVETPIDFSAEIRVGMRWLDEHRPGWLGSVDIETLGLMQACNCVLGQTGGFGAEDAEEARETFEANGDEPWVFAHGFDCDADYGALTDQWRTAILARRAPESA